MIISRENQYIFVAVPKTGTTSIQEFLLNNDPTARKNAIEISGKIYSFLEHNSALRIREILGEEYLQFRVFGFIREPYSRIVSSYHFYKNGEPIAAGNKNPWPAYIRILFARLFPFKIWALLYPYKSNIEHLTDENGAVMVDFIGTFEHLNSDLKKILQNIGLEIDVEKLPHTNKSKHLESEKYFKPEWFKKIILKKIKKDIDFYQQNAFQI